MTRTEILAGVGGALGALVLGTAILGTNPGEHSEAQAPVAMMAVATEIDGAGKAPLVSAMLASGAAGQVECKRGAVANYPSRIYCADGGVSGFLLNPEAELVLFAEVEAKVPGATATGVRFALDEQGTLYVIANGTAPAAPGWEP